MGDAFSTSFKFAGYLLAKSFAILAGAPCEEVLVPIGLVGSDENPNYIVFEAQSQQEAVGRALATMKEAESTAENWAFVHEGFLRSGDGRVDAFIVRLWTKGQAEATMLVQPWRKQEASCESATLTRIGPPRLLIDGSAVDLSDAQLAALESGIKNSAVEIAAWEASGP